ncbi:MAG: alanyl-tRNA editing protein [Thermoplasmatales archaeon]
MKTIQVYLEDSYLRELDAEVVEVGEGTILDKTIFYAASGGQPSDSGVIEGNRVYEVKDVTKHEEIVHVTDPLPSVGEKVRLRLDWERRYKLMRQHTAIHVVSSIAMKEFSAMITGNQINQDYSRIDFNFKDWNNDISKALQNRVNEELQKNQEITVLSMKREEILKVDGALKVDPRLLPPLDILRVVKIGDIDMQPDGGTHVRNTSEVGYIEIYKIENKGKNNKRMYFSVHK